MRLLVLLCGLLAGYASAGFLDLHSSDRPVAVVELYTSQGCSSCPPADHWLSSLHNDAGFWREVIPMAFHVDYWDYLGWSDRFADKRFSQRQRRYKATGGAASVYTPGLFVNGREWRGWWGGERLPLARLPGGELRVSLQATTLKATYSTPAAGQRLNVAVVGMGLRTPVSRGENQGRTLREDFVVLFQESYAGTRGDWQLSLPASSDFGADKHALVVWVSAGRDPAPLQVVADWLP